MRCKNCPISDTCKGTPCKENNPRGFCAKKEGMENVHC